MTSLGLPSMLALKGTRPFGFAALAISLLILSPVAFHWKFPLVFYRFDGTYLLITAMMQRRGWTIGARLMRSRSATLANGQGHSDTTVELMIYGLAGRGSDRDLAHEELTRPKLAILFEPCGRSLQAFLPRQQRLPAEHAIDLRPIAGVANDLSGTILDELNPIHPV